MFVASTFDLCTTDVLLLFASGLDGFLGTRGSFMMDVVVMAMFAVLPLLTFGIYLAKSQQFNRHKKVQLVLGLTLLVAVALFEIDVQLFSKWEERAAASPYFATENAWTSPVGVALSIHLCFAVPTAVLWVQVIVQAIRKFSSPPVPGPHSRSHSRWAWLASGGMFLTAVTGWTFYWMAFIA